MSTVLKFFQFVIFSSNETFFEASFPKNIGTREIQYMSISGQFIKKKKC